MVPWPLKPSTSYWPTRPSPRRTKPVSQTFCCGFRATTPPTQPPKKLWVTPKPAQASMYGGAEDVTTGTGAAPPVGINTFPDVVLWAQPEDAPSSVAEIATAPTAKEIRTAAPLVCGVILAGPTRGSNIDGREQSLIPGKCGR